jgi:protein-tyrosine-phosphatase
MDIKKMKILFLCRANIGRSQMASKLYDNISGQKSIGAGAKVSKERQGMKIGDVVGAENMIPCMKEVGIDITNSKIKQVTKRMVRWADKIIIMTAQEDLAEFVLDNKNKLEFWEVKDPKGTDLNGHRKTRDEITNMIEKLIKIEKIEKL